MISNCGKDENGRYRGGASGDNNKREWQIIPWYSRPWTCIIRHPNKRVRECIADNAEKAAKNNLIGYDQNQRETYWQHLKASDYDASKITIACEADCSAGVAANAKAAGYILNIDSLKKISPSTYTGNQVAVFKSAGFDILRDNKYLSSDKYLLRGDILLYEKGHTATNLTNGIYSNISSPSNNLNKTKKWIGEVIVNNLNMRPTASTAMTPIKSFNKGDTVEVCDIVGDWYYIKENNKYGFVHSSYIKEKIINNKPVQTPSNNKTKLNKTCKWIGIVDAIELSVRSWAGTEFKSLRKLKKHDIIEICDDVKANNGDKWYYIKYEGRYGFVSSDYIIPKNNISKPTNPINKNTLNKSCKWIGIVNSPLLNVRSWAGAGFKRLRTLTKGTRVEVCDSIKASNGDEWYYIKHGGRYGFVNSSYLKK